MCKRILSVVSAALLAAMLSACVGPTRVAEHEERSPGSTKPLPAVTTTANAFDGAVAPVAFKPVDSLGSGVSSALAGFSLDLFRRLAAEGTDKNVFVSPVSVWLALCMTYNGASGETAAGMAEALHALDVPIDDFNADNAGLMGVMTAADPDVKIAIANSIWMRKELDSKFNKSFLDINKQFYAAQVRALDFADSGAAGIINKWVEDNTNGNIKDLIESPINHNTVMFLINAVHFKAPWKKAFDAKMTRDGRFTASDGNTVQAKYMTKDEDNVGFTNESLVAARIPYASGRLEMVAVMPQKQALKEFVASLTPESLQAIIGKCEETGMDLALPKLKLEYEAELNDVLKAMGMEEAFGDADFSNMSTEMGKGLFISKVKHKSFIEVNEEGTEASAATSVMLAKGMMLSLSFNKPFVYLIRDTRTGAILFIGTLENPA